MPLLTLDKEASCQMIEFNFLKCICVCIMGLVRWLVKVLCFRTCLALNKAAFIWSKIK